MEFLLRKQTSNKPRVEYHISSYILKHGDNAIFQMIVMRIRNVTLITDLEVENTAVFALISSKVIEILM